MHARFPIVLIPFIVRTVGEHAFAVLLTVLAHDGAGGSWASVKTLARESGKSESSVHRALRVLVRLGVLVCCRRYRANGACTSSSYRLALKWAAELGSRDWQFRGRGGQGEGTTTSAPPIEIPEHTQGSNPLTPSPSLPAAGAEVAMGAGGDTPPAPPSASSGPRAPGPAERTAACLALLALNCESYPAAHGGRAYLPQRGDERGARRLVVFAVAEGCRTLAAVVAWCGAYLSRFWTLGGRPAERGHMLADARRWSEVCRPRPRPTVVPPLAPAAPADPSAFGRVVEGLASRGVEFAIGFARSRARAAAG